MHNPYFLAASSLIVFAVLSFLNLVIALPFTYISKKLKMKSIYFYIFSGACFGAILTVLFEKLHMHYDIRENMESIFALACLLSLPIYLGFRHSIEYYEGPFSKNHFGFGNLLASTLYILYFLLFISQGIEWLYSLTELTRQSRKFGIFFICPSLGFGLAMFPKIAAEYIFDCLSFSYFELQRQLCALVGWLFILYVGCVVLF